MVVIAKPVEELTITNARIRAYDVRLRKLLIDRRRGVLKIQIICAHHRVVVSDLSSEDPALRMCLSCGLSEMGPAFVVLTQRPLMAATGTAILRARIGLCIGIADKHALAKEKVTLHALAFDPHRRHIFHDGL